MGEGSLGLDDDERNLAGSPLARLLSGKVLWLAGAGLVGLLVIVGISLRSGTHKQEEKVYPMAMLYDTLTDAQAARVTQELSFLNIKFEIVKKGKVDSVLVPENKVDLALQKLARKGLPLGESPGFELFDKDDGLGATEFDKRIKYVRAVSGEIERTIMRISQVKSAKVQIVIPEKKLFSINQDPVKASVLLELQQGQKLSSEQIYGIISLASHSVEGLLPKDVTVVDIRGNVLSMGVVEQAYRAELAADARPLDRMDVAALAQVPVLNPDQAGQPPAVSKLPPVNANTMTPTQMGADWLKAKEALEAHLKQKAETNLALLLPPESVRVQIDAEFYALEKNVPQIKKIVCSVMLNSADTRIFLDDIEKQKIFAAVSDAIGYEKARDQIVLRRVDFRNSVANQMAAKSKLVSEKHPFKLLAWLQLLHWVPWRFILAAVAVVGVLGALVLRRMRRRADLPSDTATLDVDPDEATDAPPVAAPELSLQDVLQQHQPDIQNLQRLAGEDPQVVARLLAQWLDEESTELKVA